MAIRLPRVIRRASWPLRAGHFLWRLRQLREVEPALAGIGRVKYLGYHAGVAEYAADADAGPLLILRVTRDDPADVVKNLHLAYHNLRNAMGAGAYSVPFSLAAHPDQAILLLRSEKGTRLSEMIRSSDPRTEEGFVEAGRWLAAMHEAFEVRPGAFDALERLDETTYPYRRWLSETGRKDDPFQPLADAAMSAAEALDNDLVDYVKYHRSYAPRAVHLGLEQTTVTDLQNTKRRPRAYDVAHFFVEAMFDHPGPLPALSPLGVPQAWLDAFLLGYGRSDDKILQMVRFAIITRMVEVYIAGIRKKRLTRRFAAKRDRMLEMRPALLSAQD